ncbi:basic leucine zipper 2 [Salvia miltiorrhiza]|uniref:basic leucine zipper 2 n=1 Tax=Salvia miltiorrhiza TaxID=226208 RepID=UPI0025ACA37F|nr:basic leucine zipper 2 [Salvia miltiorrhiza]
MQVQSKVEAQAKANESSNNKATSTFDAPAETRKATLNLDKAIEYELKHGRKLDPRMDRKKLRRTVSNRLSAQRSRVKKAQYIHDMERRVTELEDTITVLTLRVERFKEKRRLLQLQNEALERLVQIRLNEANLAQMVLEKNKAELGRLKEVEKGLVKELHIQAAAAWNCGQQSSSGFYQDEQLLQKQPQLQMDPFLNFEP